MVASFLVETEKLYRRWASWLLCGVLAGSVALLMYVSSYLMALALGEDGAVFLRDLTPTNVPPDVMTQVSSIGSVVALALGVLAMGGEYRWDAIKGSIVCPPGRAGFVLGKLSALGASAALLSAVALAVATALSLTFSYLQNLDTRMPSAGWLLGTLCAGALILSAYAALGLLLSVLTRGSGSAVAVGLTYVLILEPVFSGALGEVPGLRWVAAMLPGRADNSLAAIVSGTSPFPAPISGPVMTAAILVFWIAVFGATALFVFSRRDVR